MQSALEGSRCLGHPCSCRSKYIGSALGLWCGATHSCNPRTFLHARTSTLSRALAVCIKFDGSFSLSPISVDPLGIWRNFQPRWSFPLSICLHGQHRKCSQLGQYHRWLRLAKLWFRLLYSCNHSIWLFPILWRKEACWGSQAASSCLLLDASTRSVGSLAWSTQG